MHHHLPFPGRPDCKEGIPHSGESLYLSSGFSGLQLRQKEFGKGHNEEGYCSFGRRNRRKQ